MQDLHLLSVIRHRARRLIRPTLFVQRRRHFSAEVIRNMALKSAGFTLLALSLFQCSHRGGKLHPGTLHIDFIDLIVKKVETSKDMRVINCIVTVQNPQICDSFLFICRGSSGLKYPLYPYFESPFLSQWIYKGCPGISQTIYKCSRDYRTIGNGQGSFTNVLHFVHLTHYFKSTTISHSKKSQ